MDVKDTAHFVGNGSSSASEKFTKKAYGKQIYIDDRKGPFEIMWHAKKECHERLVDGYLGNRQPSVSCRCTPLQ